MNKSIKAIRGVTLRNKIRSETIKKLKIPNIVRLMDQITTKILERLRRNRARTISKVGKDKSSKLPLGRPANRWHETWSLAYNRRAQKTVK